MPISLAMRQRRGGGQISRRGRPPRRAAPQEQDHQGTDNSKRKGTEDNSKKRNGHMDKKTSDGRKVKRSNDTNRNANEDGWDGGCLKHMQVHSTHAELLKTHKEGLTEKYKSCQEPSDPKELYGTYLPSQGLHVSRVFQGTSTIFTLYPDSGNCTTHSEDSEDDIVFRYNSWPPCLLKCTRNPDKVAKCNKMHVDHAFRATPSSVIDKDMHVQPFRVHPKSLKTPNDLPQAFNLLKLPEDVIVVAVSGSEKFENKFSGVLPIGPGSCLAFDSTCTGVSISDSLASGGMLVCRGEGCLVSFSNVHFQDTLIVIQNEAKVLFQDCTFTNSSSAQSPHCSCVVLVHGTRTSITMLGCHIAYTSRLLNGVMVQSGASAVIESCSCWGACHAALEVHGANSTVNCTDFTMQGPERDCDLNMGVLAQKHAFARTTRATMSCMAVGFWAESAANAVIEKLTVSRPRITGVMVANGSNLKLTGSSISGAGKCEVQCAQEWLQVASQSCLKQFVGHAVFSLKNAEVSLINCTLADNHASCVSVQDHCVARISGCKSDHAHFGFAAHSGSSMNVQNSSSKRCRVGVILRGNGPSSFSNVTLQHCKNGFSMEASKADVQLAQCSVINFEKWGIVANMMDASVRMSNCILHCTNDDKSSVGLAVSDRGHVSAEDSSFTCSRVGAMASGPCCVLKMERCKFSAATGVHVVDRAQCALSHCETSKCAERGFEAISQADLSLTHCSSTHDKIGVRCSNARVLIDGFQALHYLIGIHFEGTKNTSSTIRNSTLTSAHPYSTGLLHKGCGSTLNVRDCIFTGSEAAKCTTDAQRVLDHQLWRSETSQVDQGTGQGSGVFIDTELSSSVFRRCHFYGHTSEGVHCVGGNVHLHQCHSSLNKNCGYMLSDKGFMVIEKTSSYRDHIGCIVKLVPAENCERWDWNQACMSLKEVIVREARSNGIFVHGVRRFVMRNCCVYKCAQSGIKIVRTREAITGSSIEIRNSLFRSNGLQGVMVTTKTLVNAFSVSSRGNKGAGFEVEGAGSQLHLYSCESFQNKRPFKRRKDGTLQRESCKPEEYV